MVLRYLQGVHWMFCFFQKNLESLPPLPRQRRSAAINCKRNTSQKDWLYTRIALRALKISYSDVCERGVAVNCKKTHFFLNSLYMRSMYVLKSYLLPDWQTDSVITQRLNNSLTGVTSNVISTGSYFMLRIVFFLIVFFS